MVSSFEAPAARARSRHIRKRLAGLKPKRFDPFDPFGVSTESLDNVAPEPTIVSSVGVQTPNPVTAVTPPGHTLPSSAPSVVKPSTPIVPPSSTILTSSHPVVSSSPSISKPNSTPVTSVPTPSSSTLAPVTAPRVVSSTTSFTASLVHSSSPTVATVRSATPVASAAASSGSNVKSTSNTTGVALGVTFAIVGLALIGVVAFFVRRNFIRKRQMRRNTWGAGLHPALESKRDVFNSGREDTKLLNSPSLTDKEKPASSPSASNYDVYKPLPDPTSSAQTYFPTPPPNTANNPGLSAYQPMSSASTGLGGTPTLASLMASSHELAVVGRGFIPTLPDELPISNGEKVQILNSYDDGWCLCLNNRGEQGVVPSECLQRKAQEQGGFGDEFTSQAASGHFRQSRASSLYAGINAHGGY